MTNQKLTVDYFGIRSPFMEFMGVRPEALEVDYCRTSLPWKEEVGNARGDAHGGALVSVFDLTLSVAARSHAPHDVGVATIEISTHFLEAVSGDIIVEARCVRRGRSIAFCDGTIKSAQTGNLVAIGRGTFKLFDRQRARS